MSYLENLLAENEKMILTTRQHLIGLFASAMRNLFLAIIALGVSIALQSFFQTRSDIPAAVQLIPLLLLLIPVAGFLRDYAVWLSEEYAITNRRVIQSEGVLSKHVIDSALDKLNDVVMKQSLLGRILDYGDIEVLTGSETAVNAMQRVPHPAKFKTTMLNQKETLNAPSADASLASDVAGAIPTLIAQLDALRQQGILTEAEFRTKKAELLARM